MRQLLRRRRIRSGLIGKRSNQVARRTTIPSRSTKTSQRSGATRAWAVSTLRSHGWEAGNLHIEYRFAGGDPDRRPGESQEGDARLGQVGFKLGHEKTLVIQSLVHVAKLARFFKSVSSYLKRGGRSDRRFDRLNRPSGASKPGKVG